MSAGKLITEAQLRTRLRKTGKSDDEIEQWILQYAEAAHDESPNEQMISGILQKTQEDNVLRVKGFSLTREQYDALIGYFEESGKLVADQQIDASRLVKMAVEEIVNL
jgi:hypothetical protein